jgi:uncharacterized protein (DUF885 family)
MMTLQLVAPVLLAACAAGVHPAGQAGHSPPRPGASPGHGAEAAAARLVGRSPALIALLDEQVEYLHREDPVSASKRGDDRYADQLPDASPEGTQRRLAELSDRLRRLEAIDAAGLGEADRTDAALLRYDLTRQLDGARFHREQLPISSLAGPHVDLPQMWQSLRFSRPRDYTDYASRLEKVPGLIRQQVRQMRLGLEAGRVPPKVTVAMAVMQCRVHATERVEQDPATSAFYGPFAGRPEDEAAARARRAIADGIVPAYRELADFLEREYIPRCRDSVGASEGVDGPALYDFAVRAHTTLDLTAEQVHRTGLDEVARITAEMMGVIARSDFPRRTELAGDELLAAFIQYLRTDPRFYYSSPQDLLDGYALIAKRIDPELPRLFGRLPRNTYGVRPLPEFAAASSPTAFYYPGSIKGGVPGYFMVNTYRLDQRPRYSMIALTIHEAVPGHHLQIALADELEGQHEYRSWLGFTAFVEGWGLYSERLGLEMGGAYDAGGRPPGGLYADPYDDFGRLSFEMWRACRLVVDTGIHAKGWSRQRAIDYMLAHTALARYDVEREVDRYISWPGQATGYKIGELKIRELRALAERELASRFDIRAFHDTVLGAGAIPLPLLEERVRAWIDRSR